MTIGRSGNVLVATTRHGLCDILAGELHANERPMSSLPTCALIGT